MLLDATITFSCDARLIRERLKVYCIRNNVLMRDVIVAALLAWLDAHEEC